MELYQIYCERNNTHYLRNSQGDVNIES